MTKKDYELIAEVLCNHKPSELSPRDYGSWEVWHRNVEAFAKMLVKDNPRFDRVKFLIACGVEAESYDSPPSDDHIAADIVAKLYGDSR